MNVAISPFSVWTVLTLIREGSGGKTSSQLQKALHLHESNKAIRAAYRKLNHVLHVSTLTCQFYSMDMQYISGEILFSGGFSLPKFCACCMMI
jgi:serine protease inhibitor